MLNRKVVSGLTLFFLIIFLIFAWVFYSSQAKSHQAQQEAVRLIETDYTVKTSKSSTGRPFLRLTLPWILWMTVAKNVMRL